MDNKAPIKIYAATLISIMAFIAVCLPGLTGCDTPELEQDQETVEQLQKVFPTVSFYQYDEETEIYTVYDNDRKQIGYVFYAEGYGHGGLMTFLVGLKDKDTIEGISVIKHSESQGGFGEQPGPPLDFDPLIEQFVGLKIEDCYLKDDFGLVDGITGASVSSRKTVDIIRETALTKFKPIESRIKWQNISVLATVIPFVLFPLVVTWYIIIKQARAKQAIL